jgi:hypothetical protein
VCRLGQKKLISLQYVHLHIQVCNSTHPRPQFLYHWCRIMSPGLFLKYEEEAIYMGDEFFSSRSLFCFRHREGTHGCNEKKESVGVKVIFHWIKLELRWLILKPHTGAGSEFFFFSLLFSFFFLSRRPRRNLGLPPLPLWSTSSSVSAHFQYKIIVIMYFLANSFGEVLYSCSLIFPPNFNSLGDRLVRPVPSFIT